MALARCVTGRVAATMVLAASSAAAQPAPDTSPPGTLTATDVDEDEIVIEGRRKSERYRIPLELRTLPKERDMRAQSFDPRLACQGVGPRGCGPPVMKLITITGDGKVRIGSPKEE